MTDRATERRRAVSRAVDQATGRRWCGQHQGFAENAGGEIRGKSNRWICARCAAIKRTK